MPTTAAAHPHAARLVAGLTVALLAALAVPTASPALTPAPAAFAQAAEPVEVVRLAGASRTATAAAVSAAGFPEGADRVLVARADAYADALAGGPLAAALEAPVLLTPGDALAPEAAEEVARLGAREAVLLGGPAALGPGVEEGLRDAGVTSVRRLAGPDRFATAAAIGVEVAALTGATEALLVEGGNADPQRGWPDALAASALAASRGAPVLLATAAELPEPTRAALAHLDPATLTVVGGTAAVPEAVVAEAAAGGAAVTRLAGQDRFGTSAAVAAASLEPDGYADRVWLASGRGWPDALVAGPAAARAGAPLLLMDPATPANAPAAWEWLQAQGATRVVLVGGTASLSEAVADAVRGGGLPPAGAPPAPPHELPVMDRPPAQPAANPAPPLEPNVAWSDPATWGGRVPQAGEEVTIPAGTAVLLDVSPPPLRGLRILGTLVVEDRDLTLQSSWVVVEGRLAAGTEERPLTRRVEIVLDPVAGDAIDGAGEGPLLVSGGTLDLHGTAPARTWTRLATTALAGSTQLLLQEAPGWQPGERVVLASTDLDPEQAEVRTVVAVDGTTVTLDAPLAHTHWGATDHLAGGAVPMHAEVASLSRNLVVRSSDEAVARGIGGHLIAYAGSVLRARGVELAFLGQAGRLARYPFHFHMMGSASGSYLDAASVHDSFNRCVTIHGTHHVDVTNTVGYDARGHCFFLEDAVETGNLLYCNLGLVTRPPAEGQRLLESDATPATFWISNPSNLVEGNAAAGSVGGIGFWYDLPEHPTGPSANEEIAVRELPFGGFRDNVAHSNSNDGWKTGMGILVEDYEPPAEAVFEAPLAYKNDGFGFWAEGVTVRGLVAAENDRAFLGRDARLEDALLVGLTSNAGADRPWAMVGVSLYHDATDVTGTTFVNFTRAGRPEWVGPHAAIDVITSPAFDLPTFAGSTIVNSHPVLVQHREDAEEEQLHMAFADLDGSVVGAPATVTGDAPTLRRADCTQRPEWGAWVCPPGQDLAFAKLNDLGLGVALQATLTSDGGAGAFEDEGGGETAGSLLLGRRYDVAVSRPLSGHVELILAGDALGWVDYAIPWRQLGAYVYDGWGRWHAVPSGSGPEALAEGGYWWDAVAGTLHVRHHLDGDGEWLRLELCAQELCGESEPG